jgi:hypothetical protein
MKYIDVPKNLGLDNHFMLINALEKFVKLLENEKTFKQITTPKVSKDESHFSSLDLDSSGDEFGRIKGVYENGIIYRFGNIVDVGSRRYNRFGGGLLIMRDNEEPIFVMEVVDARTKPEFGKFAIEVNEDIIKELIQKMGIEYDAKEFSEIGEIKTKNPFKKIKLLKRQLLQQKFILSVIQHKEQFKKYIKNQEDNKNKTM